MITLHIDGTAVRAQDGETLFQIATKAGVYIPALCAHPAIPTAKGREATPRVYRAASCIEGTTGGGFGGCRMCVVELTGVGKVLACETIAREGTEVITKSPELDQMRRELIARFLADHPHACIYCPYGDGCDLVECTFGTPVHERCCTIFGNCELQRMAQHIGHIDDLGQYTVRDRPVVKAEPLIDFNYELCIGCARCISACSSIGSGALGFAFVGGELTVGTIAENLKSSRCSFCGACIEVCPTATLTDKSAKARAVRQKKLALPGRLMPQRSPALSLCIDAVRTVPPVGGVFQLLDQRGEVILIKGADDLRAALEEALGSPGDAVSFTFAEDLQYTSRENQLLQQFLQQYGRLPRMSLSLDDLF